MKRLMVAAVIFSLSLVAVLTAERVEQLSKRVTDRLTAPFARVAR